MKKNKISISQLAKICNVSEGTVDRALHNRQGISSKTRELILNAASKYGYRPHNKAAMVGIIVFDLYNEYFSEVSIDKGEIASKISEYIMGYGDAEDVIIEHIILDNDFTKER